MNTETYTYLLSTPQRVNKESLEALNAVLDRYPYFQSARALQLKGLKNENSFLYNDALKVAAAYTEDRDILFEYITSKNFVQNEISEIIQQHDPLVAEIEVDAENISEEISVEIARQIKKEIKKAEAILNPKLFERKIKEVVKATEEAEETPSRAEIQPDAPIPFTKDDTHSFSEWLKLTKPIPVLRSKTEETEKTEEPSESRKEIGQEKKFELIDKFIQEGTKLEPRKSKALPGNLAKPFTKAQDSLMTETLAKVYLQQKNYKKALQAYKILSLKNPEKSGFFADQIRAIQNLIKKEQ